MKIFVINSGGSSVKFKLLEMPQEREIASGKVERLGKDDAHFSYKEGGNKEKKVLPVRNHKEGIEIILSRLTHSEKGVLTNISDIDAVGHRVLHTGEKYTGSVIIDEEVTTAIKECFELAPLHNPPNLTGIEIMQELITERPMVAVFDNTFHRELPEYARTYALPYRYYKQYGVRKYGFHGIAFRYMTDRTAELLETQPDEIKLVSLMLGSGCTANAYCQGKSIEVSTGFTPLEGLIQSTRSGDVDCAAILYLMKKEHLTPDEMDNILNRESGWAGISGISNDLREIVKAGNNGNKRAALSIDAVAHRAKKYVGGYTAVMGGIDALVFSGGVGENSRLIREKICSGLEFLGLEIDKGLNRENSGERIISSDRSKVKVLVVNADEELVIARDTYNLLISR